MVRHMEQLAFKIVIAYENFAAGIRAKEVSERLGAQLQPQFEINSDFWKFELLKHPQLREQAALEASEADMIVISADGAGELPVCLKKWFEIWVPEKVGRHSALVALLDREEETAGRMDSFSAYLRVMAEKGSMDFFCKAGGWRHQAIEDTVENMPGRLEHSVPVMDGLIHHNAWRGWGIND